jgi:hypothetical protein
MGGKTSTVCISGDLGTSRPGPARYDTKTPQFHIFCKHLRYIHKTLIFCEKPANPVQRIKITAVCFRTEDRHCWVVTLRVTPSNSQARLCSCISEPCAFFTSGTHSPVRAPAELLRRLSLRTHGIGSSVDPRTLLAKVRKRKSSCC